MHCGQIHALDHDWRLVGTVWRSNLGDLPGSGGLMSIEKNPRLADVGYLLRCAVIGTGWYIGFTIRRYKMLGAKQYVALGT